MAGALPIVGLGVLAVAALALGASSAKASTGGGGGGGGGGGSPPKPSSSDIDPQFDADGNLSTADGGKARKGVASNPDFQWIYRVKEGDSASAISQHIIGDDRRYRELIDANPDKRTVGDRNKLFEFNFAQLNAPEPLYVPKAWNRYIDEQGNMMGKILPPAPPRV